jgi:hypothetical protein
MSKAMCCLVSVFEVTRMLWIPLVILCLWAMVFAMSYSYFIVGAVFDFLFWCGYVATASVVLCPVVSLGMDSKQKLVF